MDNYEQRIEKQEIWPLKYRGRCTCGWISGHSWNIDDATQANDAHASKGDHRARNLLDHDDLNNLVSEIIDLVQKKFTDFNHDALTDKQEDEIWNALEPILEKFSGYPDYRNYN